MKNIKNVALYSLVFLASCGTKQVPHIKRTTIITTKKNPGTNEVKNTTNQPAITIWIHGSCTMKALSTFIHAAPLGLHKINSLPLYYRLRSIAKALAQSDPLRFPLEHFYAFGWPGGLNFSLRKKEAKILYAELKKLEASYVKTYGIKPIFRIITHSHGGNVCLNLARAQEPGDTLIIEAVILLASPIQHDTALLAQSPLFKKIYSLYSTFDTLQVADPQGLYLLENITKRKLEFSQRRLPNYPNVRQVRLRINNHGLIHLAFITCSFATMLPTILNEIDQWEQEAPHMQAPDVERILAIKIASRY